MKRALEEFARDLLTGAAILFVLLVLPGWLV